MELIFEFSGFKITIEVYTLRAELEAIMIAYAMLQETERRQHGMPTFTWKKHNHLEAI